jgi:hypothetical protein
MGEGFPVGQYTAALFIGRITDMRHVETSRW